MEADLISDEKENAEHVMLVDLARNDLGRVAKKGTQHERPSGARSANPLVETVIGKSFP